MAPFKFKPTDFALCSANGVKSARLRTRFLKLYEELVPLLEEDPDLKDFVVGRKGIWRGLHTLSPYVPSHSFWSGGGYRSGSWIGLAHKGYRDPRAGLQFEFGISKDEGTFFEIWIEGGYTKNGRRAADTERNMYRQLQRSKPQLLQFFRNLDSQYYVWAQRGHGQVIIPSQRANRMNVRQVDIFLDGLKRGSLRFALGTYPSQSDTTRIPSVSKHIVQFMLDFLPVYRWLTGLAQGAPERNNQLKAQEPDENKEIEELEAILDEDKEDIVKELRGITPSSPEIERYKGRRYKRDSKTIAQLKILRNYQCQMGNHKGVLKKDGGYYVEGAHIKSKSTRGPEAPSNILILCPNHHKEFDLGLKKVISLTKNRVEFELNGNRYAIDLRLR
jgi:HNH endonuclease